MKVLGILYAINLLPVSDIIFATLNLSVFISLPSQFPLNNKLIAF